MDEHRTTPRKRILKAGTIEFSGEAVPCTVRNISISGAALEVTTVLWFPDRFTLGIKSEGFSRACHIVWRKEKRMGVAFE